MLDHLGVIVGSEERLVRAAVGHRQVADEVGQPDIGRALLIGILVEEVVHIPRLIADHRSYGPRSPRRGRACSWRPESRPSAATPGRHAGHARRTRSRCGSTHWRARRWPGGCARPRLQHRVTGCCASQSI